MARSSGEFTGLEWEAEKAYIVATSPRNTSQSAALKDSDDDFTFEVVQIHKKDEASSEEKRSSQASKNKDEKEVENTSWDEETVTIKLEAPSEGESDNDDGKDIEDKELSSPENDPEAAELGKNPIEKEGETVPSSSSPTHKDLQGSGAAAAAMDTAKKPITQSENQILVMYGPSGHSKGVLIQKLVYRSPQHFAMVVSHTTRQQRMSEMYARDFFFMSKSDMVKKIQDKVFMEYVQIDSPDQVVVQTNQDYAQQNAPHESGVVSLSSTVGDLYGTTWESFQEALLSGKPCIVLNISTKGAEQVMEHGIDATYVLLHPGKEPEGCGTIKPDCSISIDNKEEAFGMLEEYALNLAQKEAVLQSPKHLEKALEEWERVPNVQLLDEKDQAGTRTKKHQLSHKLTSFGELLNHFQNANLKEQLTMIKPEIQGSKLSRIVGPPKMNKTLLDERNMVFAIALCKFDDTNAQHTRALSTIHHKLTAGGACTRFGTHWEEIGFQGSDPTDDLRGVGVLGLMQLVWLLETPLVELLTLEVFQYCKHHKQQPPFCVLILNITCIALQALREGCLTKECNRRDQVFAVINDLTTAVLLSFFSAWQHKQQSGPMEVGMVLQGVGNFAKKHPRFMLRELKHHLSQLEKKEIDPPPETDGQTSEEEENQIEFTKLETKEPLAV